MKTVAERWAETAVHSGAVTQPPREQAAAMMMFYSGFSAALVAVMELANASDAVAAAAVTAMRDELRQTEAAVTQAIFGGTIQ